MKRNSGGLDLSGVGNNRHLNVGGGSHHRPGLSFAGKPSSSIANSARQQRASKQAGTSLFSQAADTSSNGRRLVFIIVGVILSLALAIGVGVYVYRQTAQSAIKPAFDSDVSASLAQATQNAPSWFVLAVEQSTEDSPSSDKLAQLAFICADTQNSKLSFVLVPTNMRAYVDGYGYMSLAETFEMGDSNAFIATCSELSGLGFEHVLLATQDGVSQMCSSLGVQDDGNNGTTSAALAKKLFASTSDQMATYLKKIESCVASDMDTSSLSDFVNELNGDDIEDNIFAQDIPIEDVATSEGYSQLKSDDWATMRTRLNSGLDPVAGKAELKKSSAIRSSTSVTIWNGVGVSGIAGDCADFIQKKGWKLESSGNAASFVYDETLVVYNYDSQKKTAELLVSDIGQGRVVPSAARYSFEGDILIVIGKDYKPF